MSQQLTAVSNLLEKYKANIGTALPRHMTPERMIRVALSAVSGNYLLLRCDPLSICACVVQSSILGLEPNSQLGEAYLVPFWNSKLITTDERGKPKKGGYQAQLIPGSRGLVKLARNTGKYSIIDAQPVREKDDFECEKGFNPVLRHKWAPGDRGKIVGYYGAYVLTEGGRNFEDMSVEEIDAHRDRYSKGAYKTEAGKPVLDASGNKILQGPWLDSPDWMYRKTPLKQVLKLAPASVEMALAVALDDAHESGNNQNLVDIPLELQPVLDETDDSDGPRQIESGTSDQKISEADIKRIWTIGVGGKLKDEEIKSVIGSHGFKEASEITVDKLPAIISDLESRVKPQSQMNQKATSAKAGQQESLLATQK
jgi:recombination protein RecT